MNKTYKTPDILNSVAKFHNTFNAPILESPKIPSKERVGLRIRLIKEELEELEAALVDRDLVEVADALCDLQYVLAGAVLEFGLADKFSELFEEVQSSNMSKICLGKKEEIDTRAYYDAQGTATYSKYFDDFNTDGFQGTAYVVYRESDDKVLKSINYHAADLNTILNG